MTGDRVYGDNRLPVAPQHQYRVSLRYDHPSGFYVEPAIDWRPMDTYVDYANTLKAPGYALFGFGMAYQLSQSLSACSSMRAISAMKSMCRSSGR